MLFILQHSNWVVGQPALPDGRAQFAGDRVKGQVEAAGGVWVRGIAGGHGGNVDDIKEVGRFGLHFGPKVSQELLQRCRRLQREPACRIEKLYKIGFIAVVKIYVAAVTGQRTKNIGVAHRLHQRAIAPR